MENKKWYCEGWAKEVAKEMWRRCAGIYVCDDALSDEDGEEMVLGITKEYLDSIDEDDYDIDDLLSVTYPKLQAIQKEWEEKNKNDELE